MASAGPSSVLCVDLRVDCLSQSLKLEPAQWSCIVTPRSATVFLSHVARSVKLQLQKHQNRDTPDDISLLAFSPSCLFSTLVLRAFSCRFPSRCTIISKTLVTPNALTKDTNHLKEHSVVCRLPSQCIHRLDTLASANSFLVAFARCALLCR